MKLNNKWIFWGLIMLIFIFALSIRIYHLNEKEGFHSDEILSLVLTQYEPIGWAESPSAGEYKGEDLKNLIFKSDSSLKDAAKDILKLWKNNRDSPHTNFYYSLLRISLIGAENSNYKEAQEAYIFRAGILNLVLFTISFFSFLLLLKLLIKDKSLILLGLIITFLNTIDISMALFFRPYLLQGTFTIIFTAFLIWVSQKIETNEYKETCKNMFIFAFPLALMLLTGYYSFIYAFFLGILFVAFPLRNAKKLNLIVFFLVASILAVLYDLLLYRNFFVGFVSYRAKGSITNAHLYSNALLFFAIIKQYIYLLIPISMLIIYRLKSKEPFLLLNKYAWCVFAGVLSSIIILMIAPFKTERYIAPFIFTMALIFPLILDSVKTSKFKYFILILITLVFAENLLYKDNINYKYNNVEELTDLIKRADNSYNNKNPIYILASGDSIYADMLAFNISDNQKFISINNENPIEYLTQENDEDIFILTRTYDGKTISLLKENGWKELIVLPYEMAVYKKGRSF